MLARESWKNVGQRIRSLRKSHRLTLRQLSAGSGLSPNAISLVERGQVAPTVETLCRIASALGAPASSFLQDVCPNEVTLTRAHEGASANPAARLAEVLLERPLSCPVNKAHQATKLPTEDWPSVNLQMLLCLCGQLEYEGSEGQIYRLRQGDRLSCNGNSPQRWRSAGSEPALAILVLSPQPGEEGD
jgi:transcriptional regulator with XRE-family HTH domain